MHWQDDSVLLVVLIVVFSWLMFGCTTVDQPQPDELSRVNALVNSSFEYVSDKRQFGREDYWQTTAEFERNGMGDCEDFAITKANYLLAMNTIKEKDLHLGFLVHPKGGAHMVLITDKNYVLDNNTDEILPLFTYLTQTGYKLERILPYEDYLKHLPRSMRQVLQT